MSLLRLITFRQQLEIGVDSDAQAFIAATGITDSTQQSAIGTLVTDLKGYGIWTKMQAIYPFVGGTADRHKYNLKDPRDLNAAFRLVFNGSWTHSATGATPTGGTGWANTFYIMGTHGLQNDCHISYYVRNHVAGSFTEMGINAGLGNPTNIAYNWNGSAYPANQSGQSALGAASTSPSYWINSRTSSSGYAWYRNTTKTSINVTSGTPNNTYTIAIGGYRDGGGSGFIYAGSGRECGFATIGRGLTDQNVSDLYTAVQSFQTTLGRQV